MVLLVSYQELCPRQNLSLDLEGLSCLKNSLGQEVLSKLQQLYLQRVSLFSETLELYDKLLVSLWDKEADDFVDRYNELVLLFGLPPMTTEYRVFWKALHSAGILIPNLKYSVNVAFNRHFGDLEMPEPLQIGFGLKLFPKVFRTALGRLRSFERRFKKQSLYLINTFFQGWKKGLLPPDPAVFDATMNKHRKALCETDGEVAEDFLDGMNRVASDLLRDFRFSGREQCDLVPSTSATVEYSRGNQGSLGALVADYFGVYYEELDLALCLESNCTQLLGYIRSTTNIKEVRGFGPSVVDLKDCEKDYWLDSLFDKYEVLPYGVNEPFKIRSITRPSFRTHWGLRGLQKELLAYLGRFPAFKITLDSNKDHLVDHVGALFQSSLSLPMFISGDFSAATDTLKSDATRLIFELIGCKGVPYWMYIKGRESLLNTEVIYDKRVMPVLSGMSPYKSFKPTFLRDEPVPQTNGQLMGNILSFPILCIVNYCVYHLTLEQYVGRQLSVSEVETLNAVRINGDDILFRADDELYSLWRYAVKQVGFNLSLGKNFAHREMFQINSQLFKVLFDIFGTPVSSTRVSYFNFGQLTGRKKGMSGEDMMVASERMDVKLGSLRWEFEDLADLGSLKKNFSEMQDSCPVQLLDTCLTLQRRWYRARFGGFLTPSSFALGYLPRSKGGMGLVADDQHCPERCKIFESEDQLKSLFTFSREFSDACNYYPSEFGLSRFSPTFRVRRNKPRLGMYAVMDTRQKLVAGDWSPSRWVSTQS